MTEGKNMELYTPEVLIPEDDIALRVQALGNAITQDYAGEEVVMVCVLKGAFVFFTDLLRKINLPIRTEFISVSSYGDKTHSSGELKINMDITGSVTDANVILVEDIVDTGLTIHELTKYFMAKNPKSLRLASLLYKPEKLRHSINIDYLAFEVEDKFVIGYGLDYAGRYRELPYVGVLNAGH